MSSHSHTYKLSYFPVRARGEHLRYILAYAGVQHELYNVTNEEWFGGMKAKAPFGGLPMLLVDGKVTLCQSMVIGQFLAAEHGLAGNNHLEAAQVFMYANGINDLHDVFVKEDIIKHLFTVFGAQDIPKAKQIFADKAEIFNTFCGRYENQLKQNRGKWLVGDRCSWADLFLAELMDRTMLCLDPNCLDKYPLIKDLTKRVHEIPNIKKRVAQRKEPGHILPGNDF